MLGLHEVADDPQAEALGLFPTLDSPDIGAYRSVGIPMRFANADVGPRGPAPKLGADTARCSPPPASPTARSIAWSPTGTCMKPATASDPADRHHCTQLAERRRV